MSNSLARDISTFLERNPKYQSWKQLPDEFLQRSADMPPEALIKMALDVWKRGEHRFLGAAVTLLRRHPTAFRRVRWRLLEEMGSHMDSWGAVDAFALLAGTAWRIGQISDARVQRWARSENRWWRRAALVCTVLLNRRSLGGCGDTPRTLSVCEVLAPDRDDMVVKAMSWALRELIASDAGAVERFIEKHGDVLSARVKREVRNKLTTGLKNPPRKAKSTVRKRST